MFVQHYLSNMFGPKQDFLDKPMENEYLRNPAHTEDAEKIGANRKTVREVSRLAHYLGGASPPEGIGLQD